MIPSDLRAELRWLGSGFLLTLFSGFGQTYYIALFAGHLKGELALTDGAFGTLYTAGTLASAVLLGWAGKLADTIPIRWLGAGVIGGLALTAIGMSAVTTPLMLGLVFFGLRFFGQGMLTHTAMTAMGRWFNRKRGRAVSIAGLGLPASEGLMPPLAVAGIALLGWRETWLVAAGFLLFVAVPAFILVLRYERHPTHGPQGGNVASDDTQRYHWSRGDVLGHPVFYALLPGVLAPPFIVTAVFFNQVTLVTLRHWELSWFAATFPLLAVMHVITVLCAGWLVDRYGARRLLAGYLLPLAVACLLLATVSSPLVLIAVMMLIGFTLGGASATSGALWAELYGTEHLGAIRAVATATIVLSTAVAPGLAGLLLDAGVSLETQILVMGLYCLVASLWLWALTPWLHRLASGAPRGN